MCLKERALTRLAFPGVAHLSKGIEGNDGSRYAAYQNRLAAVAESSFASPLAHNVVPSYAAHRFIDGVAAKPIFISPSAKPIMARLAALSASYHHVMPR